MCLSVTFITSYYFVPESIHAFYFVNNFDVYKTVLV